MALFAVGLAIGLAVAQAPRNDRPQLRAKVTGTLPMVRALAANRAVVGAVVEQNARKLSAESIQRLEVEWSATRGMNDTVRRHVDNPCGQALRAGVSQSPAVVEAFAMDNQGALVCTVAKTSDYFQGDEPKWQRAFAGGRGAELVDSPQFDDSSQGYTVQVSVPVKDGGQVVGVLTLGFDLDRLMDPRPNARAQDAKPQDTRSEARSSP